jgi:type II secretory pathway pseudopilin PulG
MKRWRGIGRLNLEMKQKTTGEGYTITEVMIVLAVTTALFVSVVIAFGGRQASAEFTQAVRNFEAKLESTISEVVNGGYTPANCTAGATGPPIVDGATNTQGRCVFIGKVFLAYDSTMPSVSTISTLVGRRTEEITANDATTFDQADPVVVPSLDETYTHSFRMRVRRVVTGATRIYAFGFIVPLSGSLSLEDDESAGAKQVTLYGLRNVSSLTATGNVVDEANFVEAPNGIRICLEGQNGQRAEITIGEADTQSMIVSTLDTGATGDCP